MGNRDIVLLQCTQCKRKNYATTKNKRNAGGKLEMKKFCRFDRAHTVHKEVKA
jgi:large subunit ribosomal protein L33